MANFSFVNSSSYRPYSYEQWLAPMMAYKQEYDAVQEALDEQAMQGAAVKDIIMRDPTSPEAIAYQNYLDNVKQQADILSTQGLKGADRTAVSKIRRNYAENIAPIEQAANEYKDLIKQQQQSRAKGLYVSNMPTFSNYRLTGQGFTTASPDDFYKAGQQAASAYGSQFSTAELEHFDRYLNRITQTTGVSPDVALAELGNENSSLSRAFADYMKSQGMGENSNYSPEDIAAAAAQYTSGVYAGSQQRSSTSFSNRADNPIALANAELARAQKEQQIENNKILGAQRRAVMIAQYGTYDSATHSYTKGVDVDGQSYNVSLDENTGDLTITDSQGKLITDRKSINEIQAKWATTTGKPSSSSSRSEVTTGVDANGNTVEKISATTWKVIESNDGVTPVGTIINMNKQDTNQQKITYIRLGDNDPNGDITRHSNQQPEWYDNFINEYHGSVDEYNKTHHGSKALVLQRSISPNMEKEFKANYPNGDINDYNIYKSGTGRFVIIPKVRVSSTPVSTASATPAAPVIPVAPSDSTSNNTRFDTNVGL